jgi:hypothetical protein
MFGPSCLGAQTNGHYIDTQIVPGGPLDLSAGDFTVECWIYNFSSGGFLWYNDPLYVGYGFRLFLSGAHVAVYWDNTGGVTQVLGNGAANIVAGWNSVALVRHGTTLTLYTNGVGQVIGTVADGVTPWAGTLGINGELYGNSYPSFALAYNTIPIDEFRVNKGVALYTSDYTPAVAAFGTGICAVTVPNVLGDDLATATAAIVAAGLILGTVGYTPDVAPIGTTIGQNPAGGATATPGDAINLTLSSGLDTVPDLTGLTLTAATAALIAAGLTVGTTGFIANVALAGTVVDQTPLAGVLALPGDPVSFDLSLGAGGPPNILYDELIFGAYFGGQLNLVEFTYMPGREPFEEGATNLIINRYKQQPTDSKQRGVDFTQFVTAGELLQSVVVTGISAQGVLQAATNPLVTPLVVSGVVIDPITQLKFGFTVSGGQNGIEYTVQFTCKTNIQSQTLEEIFSINFMVEDSFP